MPKFRMYPLRANNVLELYQQRFRINMDPPYQRLSVWGEENQSRFIDSIINGVDIPKLYFHEVTGQDASPAAFRFSVIDGKQRLLALFAFIENKLKLPGDFKYFDDDTCQAAGLTYDELLDRYPLLRSRFDGFSVPVVLVETNDVEMIEELFWRLNIQVTLTGPEKRNALGGPIAGLIREVARHAFFRESIPIKNDRYQHLNLAAKFLYICHGDGVVETKKAILDSFVRNMKAARNRGDAIAKPEALDALKLKATTILDQEREYFGRNNSLLSSAGRNILYFHVFRIFISQHAQVSFSVRMLERFNTDVAAARSKSQRMSRGSSETLDTWEEDLLSFDREKQSTDQKSAIERQYSHLANYMNLKFQTKLPELD